MGQFDDLIGSLKGDDGFAVMSPKDLVEQQYGFPLQHLAQQFLFGATGLRVGVFNSISGLPQSCKSPLLFDLCGHVAASKDDGGLGGLALIYEMEGKISPSLLQSVLLKHGESAVDNTVIVPCGTMDVALKHFNKKFLPGVRKAKKYDAPILLGLDSIGGSGTEDVKAKLEAEGVVGKGFGDKPHFMKYFCENATALLGDLPVVIVCINHEKEKIAANPFGPQPKEMMKVVGGTTQVYKAGFMVHTEYNELADKTGKIIKLRTLKTSFSDSRKIEVVFHWNKTGDSENPEDMYGHRFDWAMSSARILADPATFVGSVGDIRKICDVKIESDGSVTCPTFGMKSVPAEEWEAALFSPEHKDVLDKLYVYLKIDKLKTVDEYAEHIKGKGKKQEPKEDKPKEEKPKAKAKSKAKAKEPELGTLELPGGDDDGK